MTTTQPLYETAPMSHEIFSRTMGLGPQWQIERASLSEGDQRLDLYVVYAGKLPFQCPTCDTPLDETPGICAEWHRDDFFSHSTYIHATIPTRRCPRGCTTFPGEIPWEREGFFHRH